MTDSTGSYEIDWRTASSWQSLARGEIRHFDHLAYAYRQAREATRRARLRLEDYRVGLGGFFLFTLFAVIIAALLGDGSLTVGSPADPFNRWLIHDLSSILLGGVIFGVVVALFLGIGLVDDLLHADAAAHDTLETLVRWGHTHDIDVFRVMAYDREALMTAAERETNLRLEGASDLDNLHYRTMRFDTKLAEMPRSARN